MQTKKSEKEYLIQACRLRARTAVAETTAVAARRRAEFQALLKKTYYGGDDVHPWQQLHKIAKSAVEKTNDVIARLARETGTDLQFGPTLTIDYGDWPCYA